MAPSSISAEAARAAKTPSSAPAANAPERLVLYDGECGFCDRSVQWLLDVDRAAKLSFSPLGSDAAQAIFRAHPEIPAGLDSILYVRRSDAHEKVYWRSRAIFEICSELDGAWRYLSWLSIIPSFISDIGYRLFARVRYRVFGRLDACRLPSPEEKARFLM